MYRVSKHIDQIVKKDKPEETDFASRVAGLAFHVWFETFEEAKQFVIDRAKQKIENLKSELKKTEKKLPKLESLKEPA